MVADPALCWRARIQKVHDLGEIAYFPEIIR